MAQITANLNTAPALYGMRPLVFGCALALVVLCAGSAAISRLLTHSFEQIEHAEMQQKATQAYRAFEADLHQLQIGNRDYAEWDDAVAFLQTRNPQFLAANFTRETLAGLRVDVAWIVDGQGQEI